MSTVTAFLSGLLLGIGLLVSQMANPAKVLAFLDLAGRWDPSLAFVMAGAVAVSAVGCALARSRPSSFLGMPMSLPTLRVIDRRLVLGSLLFGVGWGLSGLCPGPALVVLGMGRPEALAFVAAMIAGMVAYEAIEGISSRDRGGAASAAGKTGA